MEKKIITCIKIEFNSLRIVLDRQDCRRFFALVSKDGRHEVSSERLIASTSLHVSGLNPEVASPSWNLIFLVNGILRRIVVNNN